MADVTTISTDTLDPATGCSDHPDVKTKKAMIMDSLRRARGKDHQRRNVLQVDLADRKINEEETRRWAEADQTDAETPIRYTAWQLALRECLGVPSKSRTLVGLGDLWNIRFIMESGSMPVLSLGLAESPGDGQAAGDPSEETDPKQLWSETFCPTIDVAQAIQRETRLRDKGKTRVSAMRVHVDQLDREYFDGREQQVGARPKSYPDAFCLGLGGYRIGHITKKGANKEPLENPLDYHDAPPPHATLRQRFYLAMDQWLAANKKKKTKLVYAFAFCWAYGEGATEGGRKIMTTEGALVEDEGRLAQVTALSRAAELEQEEWRRQIGTPPKALPQTPELALKELSQQDGILDEEVGEATLPPSPPSHPSASAKLSEPQLSPDYIHADKLTRGNLLCSKVPQWCHDEDTKLNQIFVRDDAEAEANKLNLTDRVIMTDREHLEATGQPFLDNVEKITAGMFLDECLREPSEHQQGLTGTQVRDIPLPEWNMHELNIDGVAEGHIFTCNNIMSPDFVIRHLVGQDRSRFLDSKNIGGKSKVKDRQYRVVSTDKRNVFHMKNDNVLLGCDPLLHNTEHILFMATILLMTVEDNLFRAKAKGRYHLWTAPLRLLMQSMLAPLCSSGYKAHCDASFHHNHGGTMEGSLPLSDKGQLQEELWFEVPTISMLRVGTFIMSTYVGDSALVTVYVKDDRDEEGEKVDGFITTGNFWHYQSIGCQKKFVHMIIQWLMAPRHGHCRCVHSVRPTVGPGQGQVWERLLKRQAKLKRDKDTGIPLVNRAYTQVGVVRSILEKRLCPLQLNEVHQDAASFVAESRQVIGDHLMQLTIPGDSWSLRQVVGRELVIPTGCVADDRTLAQQLLSPEFLGPLHDMKIGVQSVFHVDGADGLGVDHPTSLHGRPPVCDIVDYDPQSPEKKLTIVRVGVPRPGDYVTKQSLRSALGLRDSQRANAVWPTIDGSLVSWLAPVADYKNMGLLIKLIQEHLNAGQLLSAFQLNQVVDIWFKGSGGNDENIGSHPINYGAIKNFLRELPRETTAKSQDPSYPMNVAGEAAAVRNALVSLFVPGLEVNPRTKQNHPAFYNGGKSETFQFLGMVVLHSPQWRKDSKAQIAEDSSNLCSISKGLSQFRRHTHLHFEGRLIKDQAFYDKNTEDGWRIITVHTGKGSKLKDKNEICVTKQVALDYDSGVEFGNAAEGGVDVARSSRRSGRYGVVCEAAEVPSKSMAFADAFFDNGQFDELMDAMLDETILPSWLTINMTTALRALCSLSVSGSYKATRTGVWNECSYRKESAYLPKDQLCAFVGECCRCACFPMFMRTDDVVTCYIMYVMEKAKVWTPPQRTRVENVADLQMESYLLTSVLLRLVARPNIWQEWYKSRGCPDSPHLVSVGPVLDEFLFFIRRVCKGAKGDPTNPFKKMCSNTQWRMNQNCEKSDSEFVAYVEEFAGTVASTAKSIRQLGLRHYSQDPHPVVRPQVVRHVRDLMFTGAGTEKSDDEKELFSANQIVMDMEECLLWPFGIPQKTEYYLAHGSRMGAAALLNHYRIKLPAQKKKEQPAVEGTDPAAEESDAADGSDAGPAHSADGGDDEEEEKDDPELYVMLKEILDGIPDENVDSVNQMLILFLLKLENHTPDMVLLLLGVSKRVKNGRGELFNLRNQREFTILDVDHPFCKLYLLLCRTWGTSRFSMPLAGKPCTWPPTDGGWVPDDVTQCHMKKIQEWEWQVVSGNWSEWSDLNPPFLMGEELTDANVPGVVAQHNGYPSVQPTAVGALQALSSDPTEEELESYTREAKQLDMTTYADHLVEYDRDTCGHALVGLTKLPWVVPLCSHDESDGAAQEAASESAFVADKKRALHLVEEKDKDGVVVASSWEEYEEGDETSLHQPSAKPMYVQEVRVTSVTCGRYMLHSKETEEWRSAGYRGGGYAHDDHAVYFLLSTGVNIRLLPSRMDEWSVFANVTDGVAKQPVPVVSEASGVHPKSKRKRKPRAKKKREGGATPGGKEKSKKRKRTETSASRTKHPRIAKTRKAVGQRRKVEPPPKLADLEDSSDNSEHEANVTPTRRRLRKRVTRNERRQAAVAKKRAEAAATTSNVSRDNNRELARRLQSDTREETRDSLVEQLTSPPFMDHDLTHFVTTELPQLRPGDFINTTGLTAERFGNLVSEGGGMDMWLNDEIITSVCRILNQLMIDMMVGTSGQEALLDHFVHSSWSQALLRESPEGTNSQWFDNYGADTRHLGNLLRHRCLYIPVNLGANHWGCIKVDCREKTLLFYEPYGREDGTEQMRRVLTELGKEHEALMVLGDETNPFDANSWTTQTVVHPAGNRQAWPDDGTTINKTRGCVCVVGLYFAVLSSLSAVSDDHYCSFRFLLPYCTIHHSGELWGLHVDVHDL